MSTLRTAAAAFRTLLWMGPVGALLLVLCLAVALGDALAAAHHRRIAAWRARRAYRRRPVPWIVASR